MNAEQLREHYKQVKARLHNPPNAKADPEAPYLWCNRGVLKVPDYNPLVNDPAMELAPHEINRAKHYRKTKLSMANAPRQIRSDAKMGERKLTLDALLDEAQFTPLNQLYDYQTSLKTAMAFDNGPFIDIEPRHYTMPVIEKSLDDRTLDDLLNDAVQKANVIAGMYRIPVECLLSGFRAPRLFRPRAHLAYELARMTQWRVGPLGRLMGVSGITITHWVLWYCVVNNIPAPRFIPEKGMVATRVITDVMKQALNKGYKAEPQEHWPYFKLIPANGTKRFPKVNEVKRTAVHLGLTLDCVHSIFARLAVTGSKSRQGVDEGDAGHGEPMQTPLNTSVHHNHV